MKQLTAFVLLLFFTACQQKTSNAVGKIDEKNLYYAESEDTSMNAAINSAKKTINKFDEALLSNNPSFTSFAVKKRFKTTEGGEHIWIAGLTIVNGRYKGFVNNNVEHAEGVKYGDTVFVERNEITDWMYVDKDILRGGYTIREIRNHLNQKEKKKMDDELGFKVEE